jgi:hypothetical protein
MNTSDAISFPDHPTIGAMGVKFVFMTQLAEARRKAENKS